MTEDEPSKTWEKIMEENAVTATREHPAHPFEQTRETGPSWPFDAPPPPPPPSSPPRRWGRSLMTPLIAALLGAVVGTGATFVALEDDSSSPLPGKVVVQASGGTLESVAAVAKAVLPSIVRIDVDAGVETGTGSGVIYREDGYIITNDHVVDDARSITVTLSNGEELDARVVGTAAPQVDIAILKVDRDGLPAATLGSTHELEVGDLAVALGSPFGLQSTVTAGVISALHRNITFDQNTRFSDAIQTDAPINPGNSGGGLANSDGEVVGINTAIVPGAGGNVGVGFAIPIEIAKQVADQIIQTGRAQLPFLGISGQNLPDERGARVGDVVSGGPAERAGLQTGDIIVELDGQTIHSMDELISALIQKEVGQTVRITYERDGNRRTAEARLAARPEGS
jgi:putative serine protease PepD